MALCSHGWSFLPSHLTLGLSKRVGARSILSSGPWSHAELRTGGRRDPHLWPGELGATVLRLQSVWRQWGLSGMMGAGPCLSPSLTLSLQPPAGHSHPPFLSGFLIPKSAPPLPIPTAPYRGVISFSGFLECFPLWSLCLA